MKLSELLDFELLLSHIENGYVREAVHPNDSTYSIYNYTPKAVRDNLWDSVTTKTRGLIVHWGLDGDDATVVARPWDKFFNYGEKAVLIGSDERVEVTDKLDGSLGILYHGPEGWAIATRGSFASEQAIHATAKLKDYIEDGTLDLRPLLDSDATLLFEIVYPENRIVVDYHGMDELVLLGGRSIDRGFCLGPNQCWMWTGEVAHTFEYKTLSECIGVHRPGKEGLVVRSGSRMVKLKQEDYVALHRIVTNLTSLRVWEIAAVRAMSTGHPDMSAVELGKLLRLDPAVVKVAAGDAPPWLNIKVPADLRETAFQTVMDYTRSVIDLIESAESLADTVRDLPRKDAAAIIKQGEAQDLAFAALDSKPLGALAWLKVRPSGADKFFSREADDEAE